MMFLCWFVIVNNDEILTSWGWETHWCIRLTQRGYVGLNSTSYIYGYFYDYISLPCAIFNLHLYETGKKQVTWWCIANTIERYLDVIVHVNEFGTPERWRWYIWNIYFIIGPVVFAFKTGSICFINNGAVYLFLRCFAMVSDGLKNLNHNFYISFGITLVTCLY